MRNQPKWWTKDHDSAWERVKAALEADWEQTKYDLTRHRKGHDLDQDVDDTIKQAVGKQPAPVIGASASAKRTGRGGRADELGKGEAWAYVEESYAYGVGARQQYGREHADWDDRLEAKLRDEWTDLRSGRTWDEVKSSVRRGWDRGKA